jgi:hydrogenase expression/formation protein HypC
MCLAVPGKIVTVQEGDGELQRIGTVDFQGSRMDVSLVMTPDAQQGDWVLVHAGFALNTLDETEAMETWKYLDEIGADAQGELATGPDEDAGNG